MVLSKKKRSARLWLTVSGRAFSRPPIRQCIFFFFPLLIFFCFEHARRRGFVRAGGAPFGDLREPMFQRRKKDGPASTKETVRRDLKKERKKDDQARNQIKTMLAVVPCEIAARILARLDDADFGAARISAKEKRVHTSGRPITKTPRGPGALPVSAPSTFFLFFWSAPLPFVLVCAVRRPKGRGATPHKRPPSWKNKKGDRLASPRLS